MTHHEMQTFIAYQITRTTPALKYYFMFRIYEEFYIKNKNLCNIFDIYKEIWNKYNLV